MILIKYRVHFHPLHFGLKDLVRKRENAGRKPHGQKPHGQKPQRQNPQETKANLT